jgi:hypothetical protein
MAYENLCMYCFQDLGGKSTCPHCGRDAHAAVPQIQMLPGTLVYHDRFLVGRALGQDGSGIVYTALDTTMAITAPSVIRYALSISHVLHLCRAEANRFPIFIHPFPCRMDANAKDYAAHTGKGRRPGVSPERFSNE